MPTYKYNHAHSYDRCICHICGNDIWVGDRVITQDGPHEFCYNNELSVTLKRLERELEKSKIEVRGTEEI